MSSPLIAFDDVHSGVGNAAGVAMAVSFSFQRPQDAPIEDSRQMFDMLCDSMWRRVERTYDAAK